MKKMHVAILDADPRICGPMVWTQHLASGFRELGHTATVLATTKSGRSRASWGSERPGGHWSVYEPSAVVKESDLVAALDSYDLIVIPEPKVPLLDKQAIKAGLTPVYVDALRRTKTPFITALHGNDYDVKSAPFIRDILESDAFCGTIISHSERSRTSDPYVEALKYVNSTLPYRPRRDVDAVREFPHRVVGTTGRFIFNKGAHVGGLVTPYLPEDARVEMWGSCSVGRSASPTYLVFEELLPNAESAARDATVINLAYGPYGNVVAPFTWRMKMNTGQLVGYMGNYTDPIEVCDRLTTHLNLSSYKYTGGLVEFSTLEAMDSGTICITPTYVSDPRFWTIQIEIDSIPGGVPSAVKNTALLENVANRVKQSFEFVETSSPDRLQEIVSYNRSQMRVVNNPATIAQLFIDAAAL